MYINKSFPLRSIIQFTKDRTLPFMLWTVFAVCFSEFLHYINFDGFKMPWLPVSIIGTAVAFYVGFKNNSAYDRLWEARKIWGAIVNSSRMWGTTVINYATTHFAEKDVTEDEVIAFHHRLINRHIGWLYSLRSQLLIPTPWEHINQSKKVERRTKETLETWGVGLFSDEVTQVELKQYLPSEELERLINAKNTATQIINEQSKDLHEMRKKGIIEDFRHMELQNVLNEFYSHQGKCERIKKFPLPRQYGNSSDIFVNVFLFLLPFAMVTQFHDLSIWGAWLSIPFSILVGWIYIMMELIGDYSENPFEGLGNDIPMLSLCRTIEIDLLEMLGETDLPSGIEAKNGVLM